ncbi:MAG TPA: hypothetical protein VFK05_03865 [Polyangiaceae bacterium]|nr:hypothetical protein [Polyangiaceae bacterium]
MTGLRGLGRLLLAGAGLVACNAILGIEEHQRAPSGGGDAGATSASGGLGGSSSGDTSSAGDVAGGDTDTGGVPNAGSGGAMAHAGQAGEEAAGGEGGTANCSPGTRSCSGNLVVECDTNRDWIAVSAAQQCQGATPICIGAGACAALRLREGSIEVLGATSPLTTSGYVLKWHSLSEFPRMCSTKYCVTGGLRP